MAEPTMNEKKSAEKSEISPSDNIDTVSAVVVVTATLTFMRQIAPNESGLTGLSGAPWQGVTKKGQFPSPALLLLLLLLSAVAPECCSGKRAVGKSSPANFPVE